MATEASSNLMLCSAAIPRSDLKLFERGPVAIFYFCQEVFGTPGTFIGDSLVGYTDPSTMLYTSLCWYDAETGYRVVTKIKWERLRLSGNDHSKV